MKLRSMGMGVLLLALTGAWADPSGTNGVPVTEISSRRPASETEEWGSVRFTNDYASPDFLWGKPYITSRGLPVSKDKHRFEVLNAADGASLTGPREFIRDGIFDLGFLIVPQRSPGTGANLIMRAWEVVGDGSYENSFNRRQYLVSVVLGGGNHPESSLEANSNFMGTDIYSLWGEFWNSPAFPPEPSRDLRIQFTEDGSVGISAVCPQIWRYAYFIAASRNMRDWEIVDELSLRLSTENRLVTWKLPRPESGPVFYRVIP